MRLMGAQLAFCTLLVAFFMAPWAWCAIGLASFLESRILLGFSDCVVPLRPNLMTLRPRTKRKMMLKKLRCPKCGCKLNPLRKRCKVCAKKLNR